MGELGMPLMTCCAQDKFLIAKQESEVRPMGAMTGAAFSFFNQRVFVVILFISDVFLGILMTGKTNLIFFGLLEVALV
jgi:hypothetical protein